MAMTRRGQSTHLISQNKYICFWYYRLINVSNARVIRASRLTNGINLDTKNKDYNPVEVLIESDVSDMSHPSDSKKLPDSLALVHTAQICETKTKYTLNKSCKPCVRSKST